MNNTLVPNRGESNDFCMESVLSLWLVNSNPGGLVTLALEMSQSDSLVSHFKHRR